MHQREFALFVLLFFSCHQFDNRPYFGASNKMSVRCSRSSRLVWCLNIKASKWWESLQVSVVDAVVICREYGAVTHTHTHTPLLCQGFTVSDGTAGWQTSSTWRSGGGQEEEGVRCHFKVCAILSWSASLCNSHIIIRARPRPAACQTLTVWSCLLWMSASGVGLKYALSHCWCML